MCVLFRPDSVCLSISSSLSLSILLIFCCLLMALYSSSSTWICQSIILLGLYVQRSLYMHCSPVPILDLVGADCVVDLSIVNGLNRLKISPDMCTFSCYSSLFFSIVFSIFLLFPGC